MASLSPLFELQNGDAGPFYDVVEAAAFPRHVLRFRNQRWAEQVGLGALDQHAWRAHFGEFVPLPGNLARPLALRYHGHQFRSYNPEIGDGRGFVYAQVRDGAGRLLDLGTKGSGRTPYSRFGDGRLTLKGGVREILAAQMLEALGVYTSKPFSLIETGEALVRQDEPSPTRSSVLLRLSHSHIRFGAFQRLAYEGNDAGIEQLTKYCIRHFYPELECVGSGQSGPAFFRAVVLRTARLVAQWMAAGFVHGVLNTDNMNITGESFDYGPWRFAPTADPNFTAAYFDHTGLYAFGRQPEAAAWNLAQFGGALARVFDADALNAGLQAYPDAYQAALVDAVHARLGVAPLADDGADEGFVGAVLGFLSASGAPFEQFFFDWFGGLASQSRAAASSAAGHYAAPAFAEVRDGLAARRPVAARRLDHPYFKRPGPCGMLIDEVEAIWSPIADADDWGLFDAKLAAIEEMRSAYGFAASAYESDAALSGLAVGAADA